MGIDLRGRGRGVCDVLVIGSGLAGLTAALQAVHRVNVTLVSKGRLEDGCTARAQGGIAAALGSDDSVESHVEDTLVAGRGLCDERAVRMLAQEAPRVIASLEERGVRFDRTDAELDLHHEAAHARPRVAHARGDATGREVETVLIRDLRRSAATVMEHSVVTGVSVDDGEFFAVDVVQPESGAVLRLYASAVVVASGGAARLWSRSTNPSTATGDGVALAYQAGAEVASLEFMQFHPTALATGKNAGFLISEAIRGAGAHIINKAGKRVREDFMKFAWINDVLRAGTRSLLDTTGALAHSA